MTQPPTTPSVAITQQPPVPAPGVPMLSGDMASYIGWAAAALISGVFYLRRKASRDSTEIVKDRAEASIVEIALREQDKAMKAAQEAWSRRTDDASQIATLATQNKALVESNAGLRDELFASKLQVAHLKRELARVAPGLAQVLGSNFAPLDPENPE